MESEINANCSHGSHGVPGVDYASIKNNDDRYVATVNHEAEKIRRNDDRIRSDKSLSDYMFGKDGNRAMDHSWGFASGAAELVSLAVKLRSTELICKKYLCNKYAIDESSVPNLSENVAYIESELEKTCDAIIDEMRTFPSFKEYMKFAFQDCTGYLGRKHCEA